MSARHWIIAFVFGLTVSLGQAQEQAEDPSGTAANQQDQTQTFPVPLPVDIVEDQAAAEARQRSEEEAREREIRDLAAQEGMNAATQSIETATRDMRDYALYSTILVGIGTFLLIATLVLTRQANKAARDAVDVTRTIGKAQIRAYLDVDSCKAEYFAEPEHPEHIRFMILIKNAGQTPAQNVQGWATCHFSDQYDPRCHKRVGDIGSYHPVGAGGVFKIEFWTTDRGWPIEAVQALRNRKTRLWVHGAFNYTDVFGDEQKVGFRFFVEPGREKKPKMQICHEGNYST